MRYVVVVRSGPAQAEHPPAVDGLAIPGGVPDEAPPRACQATTKAGNPCQGIPGDDGFCAAHKPKEDASAAGDIQAAVVDADPPA